MTILFLDDWNKEENRSAIIDTSTTNQSFLRLAGLYKAMGVKNHAFLLALHNPALKGIDPFDPDLGSHEMMMVAEECYNNLWYFIREIVYIPGEPPIRYRAHRGNISLYWLFMNHITTLLIQIRQTGKSVGADVLMEWLTNIRCRKTKLSLITKDDTLRSANLMRLKDLESTLPFYLRQRKNTDIANTEEFHVSRLGNLYKGYLPNKSPKLALNVGRGITSPIFQADETAFLFNVEIMLPAALAAGTAARDIARDNGDPYGTLLTTTAGKKDDRDGKWVYNELYLTSARWNEKYLDCKNQEELEDLVRHNSPKGRLRVVAEFQHRQLGYTDAWLKRAIEEAEVSGDAAERDFFNKWTSGTQTSPFNPATSDMIRNSQVGDFNAVISGTHNYVVRWYYPDHLIDTALVQNHHIISIDSSDAVGQDDIGMTIRNVADGSIAAAGNYNETNIIVFASWLVELLVKYTNTTLIIERRSTGASILDYLLIMLPERGIDPFKRIYNRVVQDKEEDPQRFEEVVSRVRRGERSVYVDYKKTFGFATSGNGTTSRDSLFSNTMNLAIKYTGHLMRDKILIDQVLGLEVRNGRIDHKAGEHDDMVVSWLLSGWLMFSGRNLDHYGINSLHILSANQQRKEENAPQKVYDGNRQNAVKAGIENIVEEIRKSKDPYLTQKLEAKLRSLAAMLVENSANPFSVDALIQQLQSEKKINRITDNRNTFGLNDQRLQPGGFYHRSNF